MGSSTSDAGVQGGAEQQGARAKERAAGPGGPPAGAEGGPAEQAFLAGFLEDLAGNRLRLPSLPEVALRVRRLAADPAVTARRIAQALRADPALTARLLRVVNSAVLRGRRPIEDPQTAVTRLGVDRVRQLVSALAMHQLLHGQRARRTRAQLLALWRHSTRVGALSYVLAHRTGAADPDLALLAGLTHDIGALAVLDRLEDHPELAAEPAAVARLVRRLHVVVGPLVLEGWGFPGPVAEAAARHEELWRPGEGPADLTDLVAVANLHAHLGTDHPLGRVAWDEVPAFARLRLTPEDSVAAVAEARQELAELQQALAGP